MDDSTFFIGLLAVLASFIIGASVSKYVVNDSIVKQCETNNTYLVRDDYQLSCYTPEQIRKRAEELQNQQVISELEEALRGFLQQRR